MKFISDLFGFVAIVTGAICLFAWIFYFVDIGSINLRPVKTLTLICLITTILFIIINDRIND